MSFYAVANGHSIGIFETWDECSKSVKGYKGAAFKKFSTKESAEEFIQLFQEQKKNMTVTLIYPNVLIPDYYVYTDGACSNNGKPDAVAGIGIFFGINDPRNVSQKVPPELRQTNNVAELSAIIEAFRIIEPDLESSGKIVGIATDSEYVIKCLGKYGEKCAAAGWAKEIPNQILVRNAYESYTKFAKSIQIIHVKAHTRDQDMHSIGNDHADRLANMAIGWEGCHYN
jgi:ribonuclease HI